MLELIALVVLDILSVFYSAFLAIGFINYNTDFTLSNLFQSQFYMAFCIITVICSNLICGCYSMAWKKKVSFNDAIRMGISFVACLAIFLGFDLFYRLFNTAPYFTLLNRIKVTRPAIFMMTLFSFVIMAAIRSVTRVTAHFYNHFVSIAKRGQMKRLLIFGAGEAGLYLLNLIHEHPEYNLNPVAFIDSNTSYWGKKFDGVKVLRTGNDGLRESIEKYDIQEVIIAIPTASNELVKKVVTICNELGCGVRRFGNINDVDQGDVTRSMIKNINFEDLLRRESRQLDMGAIGDFIKDKTVLVTGGVGSIGSEICRQVLKYGCKKLIIFDFNENGLFEINNEFQKIYDASRYVLKLGSVRDVSRLEEVFEEYHPHVVFHAAAHKHVPMMECNPLEAIKNNVYGTYNPAAVADKYGADKFILISTDKAVNPTNIMGASKRMAEMVVGALNKKATHTCYAAVRFGNVLGSNGSVVPIFRKQIENGGPVTLTHPEMRRYFMTIPEAVQLVLEAGAMAKGSETFVLDMGQPVKIYDLACDLIKLYGLVPEKDIKIKITGLRPGEKLFEEIKLSEEEVSETPNEKIFVLKQGGENTKDILEELDSISGNIDKLAHIDIYTTVKAFVPSFKHDSTFV